MKIRPDKWYRFKCNAAREEFIEKLLDEHIVLNQITSEIHRAECLRYNSKTSAINYRTAYNPYYNESYEIYHFQGKEENKMNDSFKIGPTVGIDPVVAKYDVIVENYYGEKLNNIRERYKAGREDVIKNSVLGKAATVYYNTFKELAPFSVLPKFEDLVPYELLSTSEKETLSKLSNAEDEEREKLRREREEVMYLISICDTFEQKIKVYDRYGISKIMADKKSK